MYVFVTPEHIDLQQADDLGRFHVMVSPDIDNLDGVLREAGWGWVDPAGRDALILVAAIRQAARGAAGPDWGESFAAMVDQAMTSGWMNETGDAIRAHVVSVGRGQIQA
jgi:hypothetical protein